MTAAVEILMDHSPVPVNVHAVVGDETSAREDAVSLGEHLVASQCAKVVPDESWS